MKTEIVCIKRQGFSILHTEGADFAAKVTMQRYDAKHTEVMSENPHPRRLLVSGASALKSQAA